MAERTGIVYATHTFSPWWGCTKVSPGCSHCYAELVGARRGIKWGPGQPRVTVSEHTWNDPRRWARAAAKAGERRRVLVSMCDYLDVGAPEAWRQRFYQLVRDTAYALDWLLLTKRAERLETVPEDVAARAWMGVSIENADYLSRLDHLFRSHAARRWLSLEPLLGPLELSRILDPLCTCGFDGGSDSSLCNAHGSCGYPGRNRLNWIVAGAESGPGARPMHPQWDTRTRPARPRRPNSSLRASLSCGVPPSAHDLRAPWRSFTQTKTWQA